MRQIVSLVKDNQVHYAVVDEDSGELIPFADVLLPNPQAFGLHEAAVLGTNLIQTLGLNGYKRRSAPPPETPSEAPEGPRERRNRIAREQYAEKRAAGMAPKLHVGGRPRKDGQPQQTHPEHKVQAFIPTSTVVQVVNEHGQNGLTSREIAGFIGGTSAEDAEKWLSRTVDNRITAAREAAKRGQPMPFRIEYDEAHRNARNQAPRKLYPL